MEQLKAGDFAGFFQELYGKEPFPWQQRLAEQVCEAEWPESIDLPTSCGKTACIDIAVFALAVRRVGAPRRIFFVVDRRVVVQEAFERSERIAEALKAETPTPIVGRVAEALRQLAGGEEADPLACYELRGGTYRDEEWVRHPLQPTVIASTVDQVGSRLLFRGYGISEGSWPIHAGMIANDSIIFLDEAHCSKPFGETLSAVERYRGEAWAEAPLGRPFHFVEMTATPSRMSLNKLELSEQDRENPTLQERLTARKPTHLLPEVKSKKNDFDGLVTVMADEVVRLAKETRGTRAAVIVNRVRTAKQIHERLVEQGHNAILMIGRMRPIDRDGLMKLLEPLKSGKNRIGEATTFVVSTQCLEVGADLDFDVMVSECAGVDALLQRFGRLDRLGIYLPARGSIAIASWQTDPKKPDAVYGAALANTWAWINSLAVDQEINMGIESRDERRTVREALRNLDAATASSLRMETASAPVLLPAHIDALVQTSPTPAPEPAVELFLHGPVEHAADVQVVWRGDLGTMARIWPDIVGLCPPVAREAMPVQFATFRKYVNGFRGADPEQSDLDGRDADSDYDSERSTGPLGLIWRTGRKKPSVLWNGLDLRPGDTVVLPSTTLCWNSFGHFPEGTLPDLGDPAKLDLKRRVTLRLHPDLIVTWGEIEAVKPLLELIKIEEWKAGDFAAAVVELQGLFPDALQTVVTILPDLKKLELIPYPDGPGYVLQGWRPTSKKEANGKMSLQEHTRQVEQQTDETCATLLPAGLAAALNRAAHFHDAGKVDSRFQTWLRGGDQFAGKYAPGILAKSGLRKLDKQEKSGLPKEFRHELLSLLLAGKSLSDGEANRTLVLHLIASHHGYCRPFAPIVVDCNAENIAYEGVEVNREECITLAAHRLNSGVPDRFWKLTRQYGWWGLAYLEGLLRVSDWAASEQVSEEVTE